MNLVSLSSRDTTLLVWMAERRWLISFGGAFLLHGVAAGILWWLVQSRDELVILRYNAYLGIDLLGVWWQLFLVPAVSFFFVLVNLGLARLLWHRGYRTATNLFLVGIILLSGTIVVAALALAFINV